MRPILTLVQGLNPTRATIFVIGMVVVIVPVVPIIPVEWIPRIGRALPNARPAIARTVTTQTLDISLCVYDHSRLVYGRQ